ncbi:hypothetical protein SAMN04487866_10935 [Thermoactinomyces sp. DSM 45891]|uniref:hypothetical protein n=1 Tax=Thermoactinomyces sp. DSM 45891 TaxID=1761907 RepID=UPI000921385F|nr:hypothetical protein [Thermoactinomyces sp. DSM 45891]SFX48123.1 hypothetical protein SAMN04487866_10935 [Thermoactinomyces sp. DSM 45891]
MSYILKKGSDAVKDALTEKVDYSKVLGSLSNGKSYAIRLIPNCVSSYKAHNVYNVFNTTPCTKEAGQIDLYDLACDSLYQEAESLKRSGASDSEVKLVRDRAYAVKAKTRYLLGAVNLDGKQPIVLDFTSNQGKEIMTLMKKQAKKLDRYPFFISKSSEGKVSLDIVLYDPEEDDEDALTPQQRKNFEETKGFEFDDNLFDKVLRVNSTEQQIEDLRKFGFDVSRIGIGSPEVESDSSPDETLGF